MTFYFCFFKIASLDYHLFCTIYVSSLSTSHNWWSLSKKSHLNQDQDLWSNIMFAKCSDDVQFSMMQSGGYVFYIRIGLNNVFGSENKEDTVTLQKTLAGHTIWSNNALFRRERNEIHRHAKTLHSKSWRIRILGNANVFSCLDIVVIYRLMRRPFIFLTRKTNLVYQMSISL